MACPKTMAGVGHFKRIWKDACRLAGAVQETCSSEMSGGQDADFLRGAAFWSIRSSHFLPGLPRGLPEGAKPSQLRAAYNYVTNCCITEVSTKLGERGNNWYQAVCPLRSRSWQHSSSSQRVFQISGWLIAICWANSWWSICRFCSSCMSQSRIVVAEMGWDFRGESCRSFQLCPAMSIEGLTRAPRG